MCRRPSLAAAVVLAVLLSPALAGAQAVDLSKYKAVGDIKGTIKKIDGNLGVVEITDSAGKSIYVKMLPTTTISIDATAEPSFLTPGVVVDFSAESDSKGQIKGEIKAIRITELTKTVEPAFGPEDFANRFDPKDKDKVVKCFIRGTIVSNKDGELQIKAPNVMVKGKLAEDPKITVMVTDYRLAQEGDALTVQVGREFQPNQIFGTNVNIKCAQPLAAKTKGARRPAAK